MLRDYDDSSDDEENGLDYRNSNRKDVNELVEELHSFNILHSGRIDELTKLLTTGEDEKSQQELEELEELEDETLPEKLLKELEELVETRQELEYKIFELQKGLLENPAYVMEMAGRQLIYKHLPEYRVRKNSVLKKVDWEIKDAITYNKMFVLALKNVGIITDVQIKQWKKDQGVISFLRNTGNDFNETSMEFFGLKDRVFFTEQNKFLLLRKLLRQSNNEIIDDNLLRSISNFILSLFGDWDLCLTSDLPKNVKPECGKLYLAEEGTFLKYYFIDIRGKKVEGSLKMTVENKLKDFLVTNQSDILAMMSRTRHTPLGMENNINSVELKKIIDEFFCQLPKAKRSILSKTRVNLDLKSVEDFYAEELLRYRSLIRSSREIESENVEVAQTLVFSAHHDLASQKKQSISRDLRQDSCDKDKFPHRGTIEEEVFNLGNYETVLEKLNATNLNHKSLAILIKEVFLIGAHQAFNNLSIDRTKTKVSEFLSQQSKQTIIDTVELLFGTEGFRSPSSIVETNMMLDLIINDPENWNFQKAFMNKEKPEDYDLVLDEGQEKIRGKIYLRKENTKLKYILINPRGDQFEGILTFNKKVNVPKILTKKFLDNRKKEILAVTLKKGHTQQENGGALSYTMKTKDGRQGGIPCGRKLSHNFDELFKDPSLKKHKYGGPFKARNIDFNEYKKRKEEVTKSWIKKFYGTSLSIDLEQEIQRSIQTRWYKPMSKK